MAELFKLFINIILLQSGPQDLPFSKFLLKFSILIYFFAGVLVALLNFTFLNALEIAAIDTVMLALMISLLLKIQHLTNRIPQTLIAIFGALGLFSLISLPVDIWYNSLSTDYEQDDNLLSAGIIIFLSVWGLAILGHILRHALNINHVLAAGISVFYMLLSIFITTLLFIPVNSVT